MAIMYDLSIDKEREKYEKKDLFLAALGNVTFSSPHQRQQQVFPLNSIKLVFRQARN